MFFDAWRLTKFPSTRRLFLSLKFFLPESNVKNLFPNSNSSREKEIRSNRAFFASIPLRAFLSSSFSPSRAPMPRNGTKLTLTIVVSSWLAFLRVDRLR